MSGSLFFKTTLPVCATDVDVERDEVREPDLVLEENTQQECARQLESQNGQSSSPPWHQPRTVIEVQDKPGHGGPQSTAATAARSVEKVEEKSTRKSVPGSYYPALKKRLEQIPTLSSQSRQSLYRDRYTGQFWLGLRASMGSSWSQQVEVLKPLGLEVAKSLTCKSNHAAKLLSSATLVSSVLASPARSGRLLH